jgi:polar amino acid transport system permease protein
MFWYFAVPEMLPDETRRALYKHDVGFYAALAALILYSAAFISEDLRSGIRAFRADRRKPPIPWASASSIPSGWSSCPRLCAPRCRRCWARP